jgi:murein L,D-transpeptidase YafK
MKNGRSLAILCLIFFACTSFFHRSYLAGGYYIIIDKSDYELNVYDKDGWLVAYPVVFGSNDQGDKLFQGDKRTPEGTFSIASKRVHEKWDRMMLLNYPTAPDIAAFNERKRKGLLPTGAKLGGGIGIHGTWPHEEYAVDRYLNWTEGCISMKNEHVEQLYKIIGVGTSVTIKK